MVDAIKTQTIAPDGPIQEPFPKIQGPVQIQTTAPEGPIQSPFDTSLVTGDDGGIDFEASQTKILEASAALKTEADATAAKTETTANGFVSSSAPIIEDEKTTTQAVTDMTPTPVETGAETAITASDAFLAGLDNEVTRLEARRKEEVLGIEQSFTRAKAGLEQEQEREKGSTATTLARIGGFLGPSGSATGVLLNLAQSHRDEVSTLEGKKAEAIRQANNAIEDKQFAIARMRVQEVKDIEQTIHDRKVDFFNDSITAQKEARQQDEFLSDKFSNELDAFGKLAVNDPDIEMDPAKAQAIDDFYGVPGFTAQYLDIVHGQAQAEEEDKLLEQKTKLLNFLSEIPNGQTITFPDGTSYTGLGKAGDVFTTVQTDDSGFSRIVTHDKRTNQTTVSGIGQIGKTSAQAGSAETNEVMELISINLEANKNAETGLYEPESYLALRNELKLTNPGVLKLMDNTFLKPTNDLFSDDAITFLRSEGVFADDRF